MSDSITYEIKLTCTLELLKGLEKQKVIEEFYEKVLPEVVRMQGIHVPYSTVAGVLTTFLQCSTKTLFDISLKED